MGEAARSPRHPDTSHQDDEDAPFIIGVAALDEPESDKTEPPQHEDEPSAPAPIDEPASTPEARPAPPAPPATPSATPSAAPPQAPPASTLPEPQPAASATPAPGRLLDNILTMQNFIDTPEGRRIFVTTDALRWFVRINHRTLVNDGAIVRMGRRIMICRPAFDDAMYRIMRERARSALAD